jgi:hypothetical protein
MEIGSLAGCVSFLEKYASKKQDRSDGPPSAPPAKAESRKLMNFIRDSGLNPAGKTGKVFFNKGNNSGGPKIEERRKR